MSVDTNHKDYNNRYDIVFDGDSDRTFHGDQYGAYQIDHRGTGTLSFLGAYRGRVSQVKVHGGCVVFGGSKVPGVYVYDGGRVEIPAGVTNAVNPVLYAGSFLGGLGATTAKLEAKNTYGGAGFAPGIGRQQAGELAVANLLPTGDMVLRVGFDLATNSCLNVTATFTVPTAGSTITVQTDDFTDGARRIKSTDVFTILKYKSIANAGSIQSFTVENLSPKRLDTTRAVVTLDTAKKAVYLTGVESTPQGVVIILR